MPLVLICMLIGTIVAIYFKKATAEREEVTQYQDLLYRSFILLGISTIISVLIFMFRIWYFGSPFPQPVMAKSTGISLDSLRLGIDYFYTNLFGADPYLSILAMLAAFGAGYAVWDQAKAKMLNPLILFSLLFLAAYSSFILLSGGDGMEGGRFFVHLLPVAVMFIPFALLHLGKSKLLLTIVTVALLIIQAKTIVNFATHKSTGVPIWGLASFEESLEKYDVSNFSWFEKYNLLNLRDIPVIYYLSDFVERIADYKTDTVSIMSGQMGMVPYHITKKYFGQIRLIDRNGLVDRIFTTCKITQNLSRTRWGLRVSYYFYFDNQKAIEEHCGLVRPDIIFGLGLHDDMIALLAKNNFTVMYYQSGDVVIGNRTWLSGRKVTADGEFIAIRNDLLPALHGIKPIHLDFRELEVI